MNLRQIYEVVVSDFLSFVGIATEPLKVFVMGENGLVILGQLDVEFHQVDA